MYACSKVYPTWLMVLRSMRSGGLKRVFVRLAPGANADRSILSFSHMHFLLIFSSFASFFFVCFLLPELK